MNNYVWGWDQVILHWERVRGMKNQYRHLLHFLILSHVHGNFFHLISLKVKLWGSSSFVLCVCVCLFLITITVFYFHILFLFLFKFSFWGATMVKGRYRGTEIWVRLGCKESIKIMLKYSFIQFWIMLNQMKMLPNTLTFQVPNELHLLWYERQCAMWYKRREEAGNWWAHATLWSWEPRVK